MAITFGKTKHLKDDKFCQLDDSGKELFCYRLMDLMKIGRRDEYAIRMKRTTIREDIKEYKKSVNDLRHSIPFYALRNH